MIDLKYPVLLVHGLFFRDRKIHWYWGRIPKFLEKEGVRCFYGEQDGTVDVRTNGEFLAKRIREILEITGADKVNVIAHCKGGMDMRYAITHAGAAPYVASLTSLGVPYKGSAPLERGMKNAPKWFLKGLVAVLNFYFRLAGDKHPDALEGALSCTPSRMEIFNRETPDDPRVYYQSYAFVCPSRIIHPYLFFFHLIVNWQEGENDGLLTPDSVKGTNFKGVIRSNGHFGVSHCDIADWRHRRLTRKKGAGISDILDFYKDVLEDLAARGF